MIYSILNIVFATQKEAFQTYNTVFNVSITWENQFIKSQFNGSINSKVARTASEV